MIYFNRKYFKIISQFIVITFFAACKKETTTPNNSNSNPIQYQAGPGFNYQVNALIVFNGNLVAAHLDSASQWNGTNWSSIGSPLNGTINALIIYNGNLVAAGGTDYSNNGFVEMWNGSSWQPIGNGFNASVNALTVYNGNLIAGGQFDTTQHGVANKVAEWNGTKWLPIADSGMQVWSSGINALTVYNGNLVMAGSFSYSGKYTAYNIALFNGSTWLSLGAGLNATIFSLLNYNGNLIAGGTFREVIGIDTAKNIAQWNGSAWTTVGTSEIGTPAFNNQGTVVLSLTDYNNNLIAGGSFFSIGSSSASGLVEYNGSSWTSPFGSIVDYYLAETNPGQPYLAPGPDAIYSSVIYNGNLIIGGNFNNTGGIHASCIAQWNGSTWSAL